MTRMQQLTQEITKIVEKNRNTIRSLETSGPNGGNNAATIDGWAHSPSRTITRAANMVDVDLLITLPYWSGSNPTPATAIPVCIYNEVVDAYCKIFNKDRWCDLGEVPIREK